MHTKLFFGMIARLPRLLFKRVGSKDSRHWASLGERGGYLGLRLVVALYALLGTRLGNIVIAPIVLYFFLTGRSQRRASSDYLTRVFQAKGWPGRPNWLHGFRHFRGFGLMAIERLAAWRGDITVSDLILPESGELQDLVESGDGLFVITSHLGNVDVCRALSRRHPDFIIDILMHTRHAAAFKRITDWIAPNSGVNVMEVDSIGPATMIDLAERADAGHWIAMAGDRTPVEGGNRVQQISFLGRPAPFSEGPIIVAHLLGRPVYLMFCLREGDRHRVVFEKFADRIELSRDSRQADIAKYLAKYVKRLEELCLTVPYQWYNFYDFWDQGTLGCIQLASDRETS